MKGWRMAGQKIDWTNSLKKWAQGEFRNQELVTASLGTVNEMGLVPMVLIILIPNVVRG